MPGKEERANQVKITKFICICKMKLVVFRDSYENCISMLISKYSFFLSVFFSPCFYLTYLKWKSKVNLKAKTPILSIYQKKKMSKILVEPCSSKSEMNDEAFQSSKGEVNLRVCKTQITIIYYLLTWEMPRHALLNTRDRQLLWCLAKERFAYSQFGSLKCVTFNGNVVKYHFAYHLFILKMLLDGLWSP